MVPLTYYHGPWVARAASALMIGRLAYRTMSSYRLTTFVPPNSYTGWCC